MEERGYTKLATWMGRYPEMALFRSFTKLNMQNLLCMQAEILRLEADFRRRALFDRNSGDPGKELYDQSWYALSKSIENGDDLQNQTMMELRPKLKAYSM